MNLERAFLGRQQQEKIVEWVEESIFLTMTEHYEKFLIELLLSEFVSKTFPEECLKVFRMLVEKLEKDSSQRLSLCQKYYTEREWKEYKDSEEKRKIEEKALQEQKILNELKTTMSEELQSAENDEDLMDKIGGFMSKYRYGNDKAASICVQYLAESFSGRQISGKKKVIYKLLDKLMDMWRYAGVDWMMVKNIINKMEVVLDETGDN